MAREYIREMREVQPEGPYLLAGECVGGIVAYEMAQQLREQGLEVGLVALMDAARPTDEYYVWLEDYLQHARRERGKVRLMNHWRNFVELPRARESQVRLHQDPLQAAQDPAAHAGPAPHEERAQRRALLRQDELRLPSQAL